jgi:hypothetical protein
LPLDAAIDVRFAREKRAFPLFSDIVAKKHDPILIRSRRRDLGVIAAIARETGPIHQSMTRCF